MDQSVNASRKACKQLPFWSTMPSWSTANGLEPVLDRDLVLFQNLVQLQFSFVLAYVNASPMLMILSPILNIFTSSLASVSLPRNNVAA